MRAIFVTWLLIGVTVACLAGGRPNFSGMTPDYEVDVCVLGGGPSGTAAAIAAARNGANTLLIEQYGYLGGMGTAASVNVFMTYRYAGGILREVLHELDTLSARRGPTFDANMMRVALDRLVQRAKAKVLFHTRGVACVTAPGVPWQGKSRTNIAGVIIHNKSGLQMVRARVYVDCTGDADLAAWAGAPFEIGRPEDGSTQPMTMIFRMGGCEYKGGSLMQWPEMEDYWASYAWNPNPGEITLNMTRVKGYSGVNGEDLSAATTEGREAVLQAVRTLTQNVPGFERAYLVAMPAQIGVRESRRVMGATVLTGEQIINPRHRHLHRYDVIARNNYDVDIHDPKGTKAQIVRLKRPYDIPYRCLLPRDVGNLLIAGRPISADHVAHSSLRIQPTCYALGQAAGTAAAIAADNRVGPWEVGQASDPTQGQALLRRLQVTLIQQGADLGPTRARQLELYDEWYRWQLKFRLEAFGVHRDFEDVPPGHPAYEAVMGLCRMGVFRGQSETQFGAEGPTSVAVAAVVIARCLALLPSEETPPAPVSPPERLKGQWWSTGIAECLARGIITSDELAGLQPGADLTPAALRTYLARAFPSASPLPHLHESLVRDGIVSRAGLAYWVWPAMGSVPPR